MLEQWKSELLRSSEETLALLVALALPLPSASTPWGPWLPIRSPQAKHVSSWHELQRLRMRERTWVR